MKKLFYLKWLFLVGIAGFLLGKDDLKVFLIFIIIFIIDFIYKYIENVKALPYYNQWLRQKWGQKYLERKYKNNAISIDNHVFVNEYILPFKGEWFVEYGGINKASSHSWNLISQRYAYDFEIRDEDNKIYNKDFYDLNDNYCYGKEVIAPLDGVVVSIVDKFSDESMRLDRLANSSASDIRGNHIIIKHSNGEYSMLAHLLKGSILVKKNDCIKQGDVIAKCGNSGNTNGPHLHFQVSNGPSFTFNASLPIKFKGIGFINAPSNISNID